MRNRVFYLVQSNVWYPYICQLGGLWVGASSSLMPRAAEGSLIGHWLSTLRPTLITSDTIWPFYDSLSLWPTPSCLTSYACHGWRSAAPIKPYLMIFLCVFCSGIQEFPKPCQPAQREALGDVGCRWPTTSNKAKATVENFLLFFLFKRGLNGLACVERTGLDWTGWKTVQEKLKSFISAHIIKRFIQNCGLKLLTLIKLLNLQLQCSIFLSAIAG